MPSSHPSKTKARPAKSAPAKSSKPVKKEPAKAPSKSAPKPPAKVAPKAPSKVAPKGKTPPKPAASKKAAPPPEPAVVAPEPRRVDGRRHLLSLSFVRDGDEFLARMETDSGHITELKNRALDQLLTLVAGELEDLLD
jgi:hypothetical protein